MESVDLDAVRTGLLGRTDHKHSIQTVCGRGAVCEQSDLLASRNPGTTLLAFTHAILKQKMRIENLNYKNSKI